MQQDNVTITLEMDEYVNQLLDAYIQGLDTARAVLNGISNNKEEMMEVFKAKLQDRHKSKVTDNSHCEPMDK
jgi:hypothetical protein